MTPTSRLAAPRPPSAAQAAATDVARRLWHGPARAWAAWALAGVALILLSGVFVDHPLARFAHERISVPHIGRRLVHIPELAMLLALAVVVGLGFWHAYVARLEGVWRATLLAAIGMCVALALTTVMKIWFGRIPPERWYFQQWRNFYAYLPGSFPSGHMTVMGAIAPVLWQRARPLFAIWVTAALAACAGLVAVEGHFVSDLIGGALVGGSVGFAMLCTERERRH